MFDEVEANDLRGKLAEESREGLEERGTGGDVDHREHEAVPDPDAVVVCEVQEDKPLSGLEELR